MNRLIAVGVLALALSMPATAAADVQVLGDEGAEIVSFGEAKCRKGGKLLAFTASAKRGGWTLSVDIFRSLRRTTNLVFGGDGDAQFTVKGPGGSFTNLNRPPQPPPGGGAIKFNKGFTRMGLGFIAAFDDSLSSSVSVGGALKCNYPKKKKKKRRR